MIHNLPCFCQFFAFFNSLSLFLFFVVSTFYSATTKSHLSCVLYPVQCLWWKFCFLFHCVLLPIYSSDENYVTTKYETMYNAHWNALESIWLIAVMCKDLVHFHDHKGRMHCANPFLNFIICFIFIKSILLECISRNTWQWITGQLSTLIIIRRLLTERAGKQMERDGERMSVRVEKTWS